MSHAENLSDSLILEILEQHAFLLGDPISADELPETLENGVRVTVDFRGEHASGRFVLGCPEDLSEELVVNVLGLDDASEASPEDAEDALKELVNVVAGRLLGSLEVGREALDLDVPRIERALAPDEWSRLRSAAGSCAVLVEDVPAVFLLDLDA